MTTAEARQLAQQDPVPNLAQRWGETVAEAGRKVDNLVSTLRELDKLAEALDAQGIQMNVEAYLGPIGNAAAAARRDLEKQKPGPTFELPR